MSAAYETGFRLADQLGLERDWIQSGRITHIEHKTGKVARRQFSSGTLALIDACMSEQPQRRLIWPLWARREAFFTTFRKVVAGAGIRRGTFKWLRRAAATAAEIERRGMATEFLQHSSPRITMESYIDQEQVFPIPMQVPPLREYLANPRKRRDDQAERRSGEDRRTG